ncbi:hypothetical protein GUJ93_ZPchr0009g1684 [Zizania palustris]|uniref:Uncharacterized protein n=1 Tax=Zizania palustris TaxID=103762 RepID=A0A8J5VNE5_ZIZPA|nr:hypothetical protein GUJ93_ZPchr0009g1684 [Zizania palustris]
MAPPRRKGPGLRPVTSFNYHIRTIVSTNTFETLIGDNLVSEPSGSTSAAMSSPASIGSGTGVEVLKAILDQQSSIMKRLDVIEKLQPIQSLDRVAALEVII